MSDLIGELGLNEDEVTWQHLALCANMETEWFYDQYEKDVEVAKATDEACLRCPVISQCFLAGSKGEYGVWGGIFWNGSGREDRNKNSHKTEETRDKIMERVRDGLQQGD